MWNETDLDDQFIPEHLVNHLNPRQKENGEFGHVGHVGRSHDNLMESQQSHLLGVPSHDMLTDAMLGHIHSGERDREQVTQAAGRPALYCTVLYCTVLRCVGQLYNTSHQRSSIVTRIQTTGFYVSKQRHIPSVSLYLESFSENKFNI